MERGAIEFFDASLKLVREHYSEELDRISSTEFSNVDDDFFFREYVWVVHATGFSAKAVGKFMPNLMKAYGWWDSLARKSLDDAVSSVSPVCNNPQKIKAVHSMSVMMREELEKSTWSQYRDSKLSSPRLLSELPYIGKVTCYHLARNIGLLECVKPDLHLVRMAKHWDFESCDDMCRRIKSAHPDASGMPLGVIDLVLWYGASHWGTCSIRKSGDR